MTSKTSERIVFYNPYMVDNILLNISLRPMKDHSPIVDIDVLQNINRYVSHYNIS